MGKRKRGRQGGREGGRQGVLAIKHHVAIEINICERVKVMYRSPVN